MPSCPSHALPPTVRGASLASHASSPQALRAAIPVDYLRCAVPTHMGGLGGGPEDLVPLMRSLCAQSLSAGVLFWCQRTAIEFLVQTFNVALREHLLPDLLSFQRAATAPLSLDAPALTAQEGGRGLRLSGWVQSVANAQADGVSLIVPVHMPASTPIPTPGVAGWAVLQSEEDGVHLEPGTLLPHLHNTCPARVRVDQAFFRADEWLGDSPLLQQTEPVRLALGVLYQSLIAAPDMLL